ncbi:MAG: endonuclease NucS domain-containing protein [Bacteroidota bacterium]|nr:endonuclease NucS domain-containing protein [Bacteroidota bacterium]
MNTSTNYEDEAGLEHFYRLAVQAAEEQTKEASARAYDAMLDVQNQIRDSDFDRFKEVLAILPNHFLDLYVDDVIKDISDAPLMYLVSHRSLLGMFTDAQYSYVKKQLNLQSEDEPTAYYFIAGIELFTEDSPEMALHYFSKIDNELGEYFSGLCYYHLKNYENAKRLLQSLFEELLNLQEAVVEFQTDEEYGLLLYDLSQYAISANVLLGEYKEAERVVKLLQKEYSLRDLVAISNNNIADDEDVTDFEVFVNNYTTALVNLRKYKEAKELLEESILLNPEASLIKRRLQNSADQLDRQLTADSILAPILHKKRAYGLKEFLKSNRFAREEKLEDLIELQIKYGMQVFGKSLEVYQDEYGYGRQYAVPNVNGFIDLLLMDKAADILYVVELKRNTGGIEVYDQIKRYTEGVRELTDKTVRGIICLHHPKDALIEKVKEDETISLFTYHFEFKKLG